MSIVYYPNRIFKKATPAIDHVMTQTEVYSYVGQQNILATAIDATLSQDHAWQIHSFSFNFDNAAARNYSVKFIKGRKVVTDYNDYLWFHVNGIGPQRIVLNAGFYTGAQLATELQTRLNANTLYTAASITFTVTYNALTGLFTITPTAGWTMKYLDVETGQTLRYRDSIAGHLFGFNTTTVSFGSSIVSDTAVMGLNTENPIINEVANTSSSYYDNEIYVLDMDQAVHIETNSGVDINVTYDVVYHKIN